MKQLTDMKSLGELINSLEYECDLMRDMCKAEGEPDEAKHWNYMANILHDAAHQAFLRGLYGRLKND